MSLIQATVLAFAATVIGTVVADSAERAEVVKTVAAPGSFAVDGTNELTVVEIPVEQSPGLHPWRIRYSFKYRTFGGTGDMLAMFSKTVSDRSARTDYLMPVVRNMNWDARTTYRCTASADWKLVDAEVDFKSELPSAVHAVCKGIDSRGTVEFADFAMEVVYKPMHCLSGGEFRLTDGALLKHVFFADQGAIDIKLADSGNVFFAEAVLRDERGLEVSRKQVKTSDRISLRSRGYYEVEVVARYADDTKITTKGRAVVLGRAIPDSLRRKSRFGAMIVNGGASQLTRQIGGWWDWRFFFYGRDNSENVADCFGEGAIYAGHANPVFREALGMTDAGRGGYRPPSDWNRQRLCLRQFLERNQCLDGKRLCLVNEPDIKWRGSIHDLVRLHRVFSEEVHRVYPAAEVQGPACSRINTQLLRDLGMAGLYECVDAVNIHAYVDGTSPESDFRRLLKEGVDIIRREFNCTKPIYITEFGWTTEDGTWQMPVSELTQARYLTRAFAFVAAEDIRAAVWFCDYYVARNYGEGGFSILRHGNDCVSPKPSVAAFMSLSRNLADLKGSLKIHRIGPNEWIASGIRNDGLSVNLVWTNQGEKEIDLPVATEAAEDFLGRPVSVGERIGISESPVYLFGHDVYRGPEWKPEVRQVDEVLISENEYPIEMTGVGWRCRDNLTTMPVPMSCWIGYTNATPCVRVAYSTEGLIFNVDVDDPHHEQPYSQERLIEGDSVTVAVDIDKDLEWQPNAHTTSFKGHRCYEYTVALRDDGRKDAYRRNAWDFDMKANVPVAPLVCTGVNRLKNGRMRYMVWLRWRVIGLSEMPKPGGKIGLAVLVTDLTNGRRKQHELFGGIGGAANPMKYGTFKFMPLRLDGANDVEVNGEHLQRFQ